MFLRDIRGADAILTRLATVRPAPLWASLLIGLAWALLFLMLRAGLSTFYSGITGSTILLPGVILAALTAGRAAGFAATVASLLGAWLLSDPGAVGVGVATATGRVATVNFIVVAAFATVVAASLRKILRRLGETISALEASGDALRSSQTELAAMVNQASAGIARVSLDGQVISANARFAELLGLSEDAVVGLTTGKVTHPDDIQPTLKLLQEVITGDGGGEIEKRYIRPDGSLVWALTSLRALREPDGSAFGYIAVLVDITAAKSTEAALRESENRFRLMADTAPSPVWLTNAEGEVEFVNAALVQFYGKSAETFMGHAWRESIHPDDLADVNAAQAAARPLRLPYGFDSRFRRHDGAWRWMRVSANPRFDGDGVFQGYVGMSFDVTRTREAIDALAQQERRQRFLLELSDGIRDLDDPDAILDHAHSVLGRVLNLTRVGYGELDAEAGIYNLRRDWTEGVPSLVGATRVADFGTAVSEAMLAGETIVISDTATDPRTAASAARYAEIQIGAVIVAPLFRSGKLRAFINGQSATPREWTPGDIKLVEEIADRAWSEVERTRAQAEVLESEARFRDIADTAPVLIWVTRQDRTRAFVNQAYVDFMGGDYETVRTADWRTHVHPDDHAALIAASIAGEATGKPFQLEARYRHQSGDYRWLKSFSRPRLGPGGEVIGFVGVAFDVTDARRVEQDLKRINELLEERVGDALAEKAKAEADLMHAQRMEAVGRLTGGVAHDFNNLLTVVIGALDMILKSPDDATRRQKLGEAALSAARRGERLTHQLLAFSRRQALRPEAVDINALVRECDPLLRRAGGEAVGFRLKLRRGGARVIVDPAQFEAALLNLIVNARDAIAESGRAEGAEVVIQTRFCEVAASEIPELEPGEYVCVTVSDTGAGMDEATKHRVFEPFFTTKAVGKGTGLGLSQVYGFARQSGGAVQISSVVDQGTEIQIFLPAAPAKTERVEADARQGPSLLRSGQSILLVEDDPGVAAIAVEQLRGLGLEVEKAENAAEALGVLERRSFDIMLTDIVMPGGMTGVELARLAAERYPDLAIILTSGYAGDDVDLALVDVPWQFLRKPYSGEQLREALGALV